VELQKTLDYLLFGVDDGEICCCLGIESRDHTRPGSLDGATRVIPRSDNNGSMSQARSTKEQPHGAGERAHKQTSLQTKA